MNEDIIRELSEVGLVRVFLGIENVVDKTQIIFNKRLGLNVYEEMKLFFDKYDINIHIGFITVEPYSSLDEVWQNIQYLKKINKLFRLGTILEPLRVVPNTKMHKKLITDGMMSRDLPYDKITYGYKFADIKTEKFLKGVREMFFENLAEEGYQFEYYCTVVGLARVLAKRINPRLDSILASDYLNFDKLKFEGTKLLFDYFKNSIGVIKGGQEHAIMSCPKENAVLIKEFRKLVHKTKLAKAAIFKKIIDQGAARAVKEIYTGLDKLN